MFKRVDTVFLPVKDLDQAVAWYTSVLGLKLRWQQPGYACLEISETPLTLYQPAGDFQPVTGHASFNFYITDLTEAHQHLASHGAAVGEIVRPSQHFGFFQFHDPFGNLLEVCWFPAT